MIKNLLTCVVALCAVSFAANAQTDITGTYKGTLEVSIDGSKIPDTNIFLSKEAGDTYALSVKDFVFGGLEIGDLDVTGISRSEEAGIIVLSKEGASEGPAVEFNGLNLGTEIYLTSATIDNGSLELELNVKGTSSLLPNGMDITNVIFKGNQQTSGIFDYADNSLAIYVSPAGIITIEGADAEYAIFNMNGAMIQSGVTENGTISIANIPSGMYTVKANNKTAKFIK